MALTPSDSPLDPAAEKALRRIKFHNSAWDKMNWYANLAKLNLDELSAGEILTLQEECVAIAAAVYGIRPRKGPSPDDLNDLQFAVRAYLRGLARLGEARIGPIADTVVFLRGDIQGRTKTQNLWFHQVEHPIDWAHVVLIHHMRELLKSFFEAIAVCVHCNNVFVKGRRDAKFCSQQCQSVHTMRAIRAKKAKQSPKSKGGR